MPITIAEALRGATIEVPTLEGTKKIKVGAGTKHGSIQRLRGEGAPKPKGKGKGDIRYRLEIEMPEKLTEEQERGGREAGRGLQRLRPAGRAAAQGGQPMSATGADSRIEVAIDDERASS